MLRLKRRNEMNLALTSCCRKCRPLLYSLPSSSVPLSMLLLYKILKMINFLQIIIIKFGTFYSRVFQRILLTQLTKLNLSPCLSSAKLGQQKSEKINSIEGNISLTTNGSSAPLRSSCAEYKFN